MFRVPGLLSALVPACACFAEPHAAVAAGLRDDRPRSALIAGRRRAAALLAAFVAVSFACAPGARAAGDPWGGHGIDDPYSTDQIVLVDTISQQGYTGEFYENRAYTCGRRGYHTFMIVYPDGLPLSEERPLWVRMHGGGVGAYDANGVYVPIELEGMNDEENIIKLGSYMDEGGLMAKARAHAAGFRFLMPSLCDHDVYSGVGIPEPNNPNSPDENGKTRAADGLLATKAAIAFTRRHVVTSHTFLHGTSAGSVGSFSVAYSFDREGIVLSGIVSDSHVLGRGTSDNADLGCMPFTYDRTLLIPKIGPLASADYYPEDIVAAGQMRVPVYHLWNTGDPACCGSALQTYTDPFGGTYTEPGCLHEHGPYRDAITANPPGGSGRSVTREVCVNDIGTTTPGACNLHTPTKFTYTRATPPGDQLTGGGDYNQDIIDWVSQRLTEPFSVVCPIAPAPRCVRAGRAKFRYDERKAGREKMTVAWKRLAQATTEADFGDPVHGSTSVVVCLYDDQAALIGQLTVDRARQMCSGKPCWRSKAGKGYDYRDKLHTADGVSKIRYVPGAAGKGKADAKGKNDAKGPATLPVGLAASLSGNVAPTVQMITSGGLCVEATMNQVGKDTGSLYSARLR
ncbi:MAG: hypothetical protein D6760_00365 [Deltaproteobacteria bacterium]|nr:MAG: hypothetical protein D6760_00365 [Deltaproteobacteria bacterium]